MLARSIDERSDFIREGDLVIVYERHDRMRGVVVNKGEQLQNRYGVFRHADWIGKPFGCRVSGKSGGFVHLLAPTPELWTCVLSHRTQILYVADISFVISYLEVRPGSIVLESGTGSGSLTTSLARAVSPTGHVYTFDFHEERASSAREDFLKNGLNKLVTVSVRDIQGQGFPEEFCGRADAIFLDLPQPWLALGSGAKMLRCDGIICSFSPCIEQVQRTCEALALYKEFSEIRTFEVLLRTYEVREESLMPVKQESNADSKGTDFDSPLQKKRCRDDSAVPSEICDVAEISEPKSNLLKKFGHVIARPVSEARGHTGYLTFAVKSHGD